MHHRQVVVLTLLVVAPVSTARADASGGEGIRWAPYVGEATDGSPLAGSLGRIRVPESRRSMGGPTIELAFVRYRTTNPDPGPPIVFLAGGPGGSGVTGCAFPATHPALRFLELCDVIGIDQRGTGESRPNLSEPEFGYTLPMDRAITRADEVAAMTRAATRCASYWGARGVDLTAYTTNESADDLDAVREALGVDRFILYGASYGSHLAIAYLRRYPERVARAVLSRVEGPDHTWKLPSTVQRHLETLHARVAVDPRTREFLPDLLGTVRELLALLEQDPVTISLVGDGGRIEPVTIGGHDLAISISRALAETREVAGLPAYVYRLSRGDFSELAVEAREHHEGDVQSAMALIMDCASGATAGRLRRIATERDDAANLLGDAIHSPFFPETCGVLDAPDLGDAFRGPVIVDVPVLFVSGALDVRTPPSNVDEILKGFAHHAHVVVENAGHDPRELISKEYRDLLQSFLRGEPIESCTIALPLLFDPIEPEAQESAVGAGKIGR